MVTIYLFDTCPAIMSIYFIIFIYHTVIEFNKDNKSWICRSIVRNRCQMWDNWPLNELNVLSKIAFVVNYNHDVVYSNLKFKWMYLLNVKYFGRRYPMYGSLADSKTIVWKSPTILKAGNRRPNVFSGPAYSE